MKTCLSCCSLQPSSEGPELESVGVFLGKYGLYIQTAFINDHFNLTLFFYSLNSLALFLWIYSILHSIFIHRGVPPKLPPANDHSYAKPSSRGCTRRSRGWSRSSWVAANIFDLDSSPFSRHWLNKVQLNSIGLLFPATVINTEREQYHRVSSTASQLCRVGRCSYSDALLILLWTLTSYLPRQRLLVPG